MPYWHSTHTRANVVGFLISSPRLLLIRKRVCAWVPTRPSVRFSRCCLSKSKPQQQLSKLLEVWYQAGSHHWYTGGLPENALWFADTKRGWCWNLHPFDFFSKATGNRFYCSYVQTWCKVNALRSWNVLFSGIIENWDRRLESSHITFSIDRP